MCACSALSFEITMPPTNVEGLQEDCTGLTIEVREGTADRAHVLTLNG